MQIALLRQRLPLFCRLVGKLQGELAERVAEQLVLHGLMRLVSMAEMGELGTAALD